MNSQDFLYAPTHEWVRVDGETATVGITDYAQGQLGDLTFVDLPTPGNVVDAGDEVAAVESVKAASEIYAPVSGEIVAVNTELDATPELINQDAFGAGWMFKIKLSAQPSGLLDAAAYAAQCAAEAH